MFKTILTLEKKGYYNNASKQSQQMKTVTHHLFIQNSLTNRKLRVSVGNPKKMGLQACLEHCRCLHFTNFPGQSIPELWGTD